ncbi:four helix bundle protein [Occallatibacter savannae]|uniref:four helix bundle protein n=1 Tax=Occallatibacter savannae TaxID=1002691 RepID=UPI000D68AC54|nr:four helix bundle protein [Occallatibacter savannae]
MSRGYRDLVVWQKSMELAAAIYQLSKQFPREEMYGITSQMRRSAVSIASNIAEGHGRLNSKEFGQFLGIARGSTYELQTQLELARELQIGVDGQIEKSLEMSEEVGRMLYSLIHSVRNMRSRLSAD